MQKLAYVCSPNAVKESFRLLLDDQAIFHCVTIVPYEAKESSKLFNRNILYF